MANMKVCSWHPTFTLVQNRLQWYWIKIICKKTVQETNMHTGVGRLG